MILLVTAQLFNPNAELVIPTGITTNEPNVKIKTQSLAAEIERRIFSN